MVKLLRIALLAALTVSCSPMGELSGSGAGTDGGNPIVETDVVIAPFEDQRQYLKEAKICVSTLVLQGETSYPDGTVLPFNYREQIQSNIKVTANGGLVTKALLPINTSIGAGYIQTCDSDRSIDIKNRFGKASIGGKIQVLFSGSTSIRDESSQISVTLGELSKNLRFQQEDLSASDLSNTSYQGELAEKEPDKCSKLKTDGTPRTSSTDDSPFANSDFEAIEGKSYATAFAICTVEQFLKMAERTDLYDRSFSLLRNLTFTPEELARFKPVGTPDNPFTGAFLGNGFTIKGLKVNGENLGLDYAGLFGYAKDATIYNLYLNDSEFSSQGVTGGVVAVVEDSDVVDVHLESSTVTGTQFVGGLAGKGLGRMQFFYLSSSQDSIVSGIQSVGGLVGYTFSEDDPALILASTSKSTIFADGNNSSAIGGLIGQSGDWLSIANSYFAGVINATSSSAVGGLVGLNGMTDLAFRDLTYVGKSYSAGEVNGGSFVGGGLGKCANESVCFNLHGKVFSASSVSGTDPNTVGKYSGDSRQANAYVDTSASCNTCQFDDESIEIDGSSGYFFDITNEVFEDWDFTEKPYWKANEGAYPTLHWED